MTVTVDSQPPAGAAVEDWAQFYRQLQGRAQVPEPMLTEIEPTHAVFQDMYLDLAEVKQAVLDSGHQPPVVTVLADVLTVPAGLSWSAAASVLRVQARRIQTAGRFRVNLDYRSSERAGLLLFCAELAGQVEAVAVTADAAPVVLPIEQPAAAGGFRVGLFDGRPAVRPVSWAQGVPAELPPWFERAMRTEYLFASLLHDDQPELAVAQYAWLRDWTGFHEGLLGIYLQSSSLFTLLSAQLAAARDESWFVPYLSRTVYTELARAYVAEAKQYEADYRALQTQAVITDQFLGLARTLLNTKLHESKYTAKLLDQARRNFDNALAAAEAAQQALADAQLKAQLVAADFENRGIPAWIRAQVAQAVIGIGSAVITFAVGIGSVFAGNAAGGAAAAGGAIEGAKAVSKAAEAGSEAATRASQLADAMTKLKKVGEGLGKLAALAKALLSVVQDVRSASKRADQLRQLSAETVQVDLTGAAEWQIYQQVSDAALAKPVSSGIEYAQELKLAVDAVAVYGQAMAAAQLAMVEAGQRYAAVSLQVQLAQQEQAELERYVDSLAAGRPVPAELLQRFYGRYLNAKGGLFAAIQGYRASYRYWALLPSGIRPSILDGVASLETGLRELTGITLDNQAALEHFDPAPQVLSDKQFAVTDPELLAGLAEHRTARWVLPPSARAFAGFDRVRLSRVRIWLDGARVPDGGSVKVTMSTQGTYQDRFRGTAYQFTAKPLVRTFEYRVSGRRAGVPDRRFPDGSFGYVEVDGVVDEEVSYAYFQPTPFAEWQISVSGDGLDLSGVTGLVMQFGGSVIPQP